MEIFNWNCVLRWWSICESIKQKLFLWSILILVRKFDIGHWALKCIWVGTSPKWTTNVVACVKYLYLMKGILFCFVRRMFEFKFASIEMCFLTMQALVFPILSVNISVLWMAREAMPNSFELKYNFTKLRLCNHVATNLTAWIWSNCCT